MGSSRITIITEKNKLRIAKALLYVAYKSWLYATILCPEYGIQNLDALHLHTFGSQPQGEHKTD